MLNDFSTIFNIWGTAAVIALLFGTIFTLIAKGKR